jgi:hypothetical protein
VTDAPRLRHELAIGPILMIGAVVAGALLYFASQYGFHRDELYFIVAGQHPDWGYVDQPPFTPIVSALAVQLLGVAPLAIRILPAFATMAVIALAGAMAREMGGGTRAQLIAAASVAISGVLGLGHLDSTTTFDVLAWSAISLLVIRLLAGADEREWLLVGLVAGIGLQNKHLVLLLGASLVIGLLISRRWRVFGSRYAWAAVAIALVIWLPNLAWQASRGFPQLEMGAVIAGRSEIGDVIAVIPFQLILAGPLLFPIFVGGIWWLLRDPDARPWRTIGWAYLVALGLTLAMRGQLYYPLGLLPALVAAGAVPTDAWLEGGRPFRRMAALAGAATVSAALVAIIMLPVLPPSLLARTPIPDIYGESAEQIGWPELVTTVETVVGGLSDDERSRAVVFTANYGEAGALTLLGDLPPVHAGHNSFADWGPPDDARDLIVLVGHWQQRVGTGIFGRCDQRATISNPARVENEELGAGVWVCPDPPGRWSGIWDELRFLS